MPLRSLNVLAKDLAAALCCSAATDGSGFGDDDSPYWAVVWREGRSQLADDSATDPSEGPDGPLQIIREIQLPPWRLNEAGELVEAVMLLR